MADSVIVRPLEQHELPEADRVFRLAFGTAAGLPDPLQMFGDAGYMHRWALPTGQAFVAEAEGRIVGTNFLNRWGSLGTFGPLTVHPDYWNQGVASALMEATMSQFAAWETPTVAFFTSSHSPKHLWFYGKFGFAPGYLTTVLEKPVQPVSSPGTVLFSTLSTEQQSEALQAARNLTEALYPGLDVGAEIQLVQDNKLGDTLLLWDNGGLDAFAVCHCGPGSEAGSDHFYVKFGAACPGQSVADRFEQLLEACEAFAFRQQVKSLTAGINTSRYEAYQRMLTRGFKIRLIGVAMHQPPEQDYCRPDAYVLDDRR
jgi:GNAT superfamily N-acetyltransferase